MKTISENFYLFFAIVIALITTVIILSFFFDIGMKKNEKKNSFDTNDYKFKQLRNRIRRLENKRARYFPSEELSFEDREKLLDGRKRLIQQEGKQEALRARGIQEELQGVQHACDNNRAKSCR